MYNQQNLGDCFLLKFKEDERISYMLIDFGSYESGNEEREQEIARNIQKEVGDNELTIILTHQHKDHCTGFLSAADTFSAMNVGALWLSYLDDPKGREAKKMRAATEKFWKKNEEVTKKARAMFAGNEAVERMLKAKDAIDLFAEQQTWGEAVSLLLDWTKSTPEFLVPGRVLSVPGVSEKSVKVYVLGPPTDDKLLRKLNPGKGDAVHGLDAVSTMMNLDNSSTLMLDALNAIAEGKDSTETENFPFNKRFSATASNATRQSYEHVDNTWRRIDHDWLSEAGRVSLHMGNLTNNSSLVLAFELVEKKKVLLFVGDAQIGNWKSWYDVKFKGTDVDAADLLSRTVFYKAGHHSSHNATLSESLELMNEKELVIMIPVNERVSSNMNFAMLEPGMLKGYNRKSSGRVLRADTIYHKPRSPRSFAHAFASKETDFKPKIKVQMDSSGEDHLFIEYTVR
jgi:beta-lactamase superfamily II metal-dependent hydrolase